MSNRTRREENDDRGAPKQPAGETEHPISGEDSVTEKDEGSTGRQWRFAIHPLVFFTSAGLIIALVALTIAMHKTVRELFATLQEGIATYTGWFYTLVINVVLIFMIWLLFSRFAKIRLGGRDARPEFSTLSWFAMLFSAGMGIGLLFFGVAEPMLHLIAGPAGGLANPAAAREAMLHTYLHWGLHPWAIYSLVGLSIAFFSFNHHQPLGIRTAFYPLLGDRIHGWAGNTIDILATVATLFGIATSLGLGVQQVNAGLDHLFGVGQSPEIQIGLVALITILATISVVKGINRGIRRVSELNIFLALSLMIFILALGPTLFIFGGFIENTGNYLQNLPSIATWNETYEGTAWQNNWTIFYWGWWISWSPFVGMFIARVSRGRTVRQFVLGVLLVPTTITFFWLSVFGNTALWVELFGAGGIAATVQENIPVSLFMLFEQFPLARLTSILAIIVIVLFFVTSSDSGSMVLDIITAGGEPDPPVPQRLFWAILEGVFAATLLLGGGLVALQTASITTGLPFAAILLLMAISLRRGLVNYVREK